MNRGLWLRISLTDGADYSKTTQAAEKLFKTEPTLKHFGEIYVIT
jgi:hypothetical protein